jgi:UDP:flavonoid glycosyltransferase YjiC (YdhE family)
VSPLVVPRPADWPAHATVCGYWPEPTPPGYRPPPDLAGFLAAGPPPVYLGFGSMPSADVAGLRSTVLAAASATGTRAVLGGVLHAGPEPVEQLGDDVVSVAGLPHAWLFPRTAGVVCLGGAGTVGAALRAGVPVGVVSHMGDQHYWGRRVHELGAGPPPLHRSRLTTGRLAALLGGLTVPSTRRTAAELGAALQAEDGVASAVAFLEEALG